jgi:hypothetical protein
MAGIQGILQANPGLDAYVKQIARENRPAKTVIWKVSRFPLKRLHPL